MSKVFFAGSKNGIRFVTSIPTVTVVNVLELALAGLDNELEDILEDFHTPDFGVLNALTWESTTFLNTMVKILCVGGRFAVKHGDLEFGVSTDKEQAISSFVNEEF